MTMRWFISSLANCLFAVCLFGQGQTENVALHPTSLSISPSKALVLDLVGIPHSTGWAIGVIVDDASPRIRLLHKARAGMAPLDGLGANNLEVSTGLVRILNLPDEGRTSVFLNVPTDTELRVVRNGIDIVQARIKQSVLIKDGTLTEKPNHKINDFIKESIADFQPIPLERQEILRLPNGDFMVGLNMLRTHLISASTPKTMAVAPSQGALPYLSLRIRVGVTGKVSDYQLLHGTPSQDLLASIRNWRFRPFILNGRPVAVTAQVAYVLNQTGIVTKAWYD